jgi:hypothetical protein
MSDGGGGLLACPARRIVKPEFATSTIGAPAISSCGTTSERVL